MELDKENLQKYDTYRVRKTCIEMLSDRNYNTDNLEIDISYNDFLNIENVDLMVKHNQREDDVIYVKIYDDRTSVGIPEINKMIEDIQKDHGIDINIIIVVRNPKVINLSRLKNQRAEIFKMSELIINITKHKYVPKHEPLSNEEQKLYITENKNIDIDKLPKIMIASDPVAKYFNLKEGQVCRIYRDNQNTGKAIVYRIGI